MNAASQDDLARVEQLIHDGADVNKKGKDNDSALYYAIECLNPKGCDNVPIIQELIRAGAQVNSPSISGNSLLDISLTRDHGNPEATLALLHAGATVITQCGKYDSELSLATQDSSLDVMQALMEAGVPIGCRDSYGHTALFWAAINGQADRVSLLMSHGVDLEDRQKALAAANTTNPEASVQQKFFETRKLLEQ